MKLEMDTFVMGGQFVENKLDFVFVRLVSLKSGFT